jgi:multidrug efflux pump subunit AcrB
VTAKLEQSLTSTSAAIAALEKDGIAGIAQKYGLQYYYKGKAEEQAETFGDMILGALVGLAIIYIVLAWVFASYARPFAVMAVIPLGFVGATVGHMVLGFDLTILSMIALVGLSGIVVNDSIILVTTIAERLEAGEDHHEAIVGGAQDRLRAVLLTSLTTIGGLTPLLFETSLQAQFLIPMAITMVFGLAFATLLVLFVIPSLMAVLHDIGRLFRPAGAPTAGVGSAHPAE